MMSEIEPSSPLPLMNRMNPTLHLYQKKAPFYLKNRARKAIKTLPALQQKNPFYILEWAP